MLKTSAPVTLSLCTLFAFTACDSTDTPDASVDLGTAPDVSVDAGSDPVDLGTTPDTGAMPDTTAPTVSITDNIPGTANGDITFTFTFSEDIGTSFALEDITVTGGAAGAFTLQSALASLVVTPPADATGTVSVTVGAMSFEDTSGNLNADATTAEQTFDTTQAPTGTTLVDFEAMTPPILVGFGGAEDATIVADPTDATNTVARVLKSDAAELWAGTTVAYCPLDAVAPLPFTAAATTISLRVWSPDAGIPVRVKVENASNPGVSVEAETLTTTAMMWETLEIDFSQEAMGTAALDLAASYNKLSVFFNFGTTGAMAGEKIYFMDDIAFLGAVFTNECASGPMGEGLPLTFDDGATTYTLIGFGGAEDATVVTDPVSMMGNVARVVKSDMAELWAGTTMATGPNESVPPFPITANTTRMSLRVWSPRANIPVRLKIEEALDPTRSVETETMVTTASAWQTIVFDFANQAPGTAELNPSYTFNKVSVFFDFGSSGPDGGNGTFYFDDLNMAP